MSRAASLIGAHVLIVEDEFLQALDMSYSLAEAGARVVGPVSTVQDAITLLAGQPCCVAVLDFCLGLNNVIPLAEELHRRRVPFVIHTGYNCLGLLPAKWRNWRLLSKPCPTAGLIDVVAELMRGKARRELRKRAGQRERDCPDKRVMRL
jgi:DNA-binding NtrC family response regulator